MTAHKKAPPILTIIFLSPRIIQEWYAEINSKSMHLSLKMGLTRFVNEGTYEEPPDCDGFRVKIPSTQKNFK